MMILRITGHVLVRAYIKFCVSAQKSRTRASHCLAMHLSLRSAEASVSGHVRINRIQRRIQVRQPNVQVARVLWCRVEPS